MMNARTMVGKDDMGGVGGGGGERGQEGDVREWVSTPFI